MMMPSKSWEREAVVQAGATQEGVKIPAPPSRPCTKVPPWRPVKDTTEMLEAGKGKPRPSRICASFTLTTGMAKGVPAPMMNRTRCTVGRGQEKLYPSSAVRVTLMMGARVGEAPKPFTAWMEKVKVAGAVTALARVMTPEGERAKGKALEGPPGTVNIMVL